MQQFDISGKEAHKYTPRTTPRWLDMYVELLKLRIGVDALLHKSRIKVCFGLAHSLLAFANQRIADR
jgi:hypothetical protein